MSSALTKLVLRLRKAAAPTSHELHRTTASVMLVIAAILRLGENPAMQHPVDPGAIRVPCSVNLYLAPIQLQGLEQHLLDEATMMS